jgi:hypothetical protein
MTLTQQTFDLCMDWPIEDMIDAAGLKGVQLVKIEDGLKVRATTGKLTLIAKAVEIYRQSSQAYERENRRHDAAQKRFDQAVHRKMTALATAWRRRRPN